MVSGVTFYMSCSSKLNKAEKGARWMDEDVELLESFKKGNYQAFERLVTKYKRKVFNTIYSIIGNVNEADDVAQEVFLKVYYSMSSFEYKSLFSTWLYRITVNKCLDELRKRKNKVISLENELSQDEVFRIKDILQDKQDNVVEKVIRNELQEIIWKVLNSLPKNYRLVLTLKEIDNLSYKEISQIMDISINRVKIWLFRARRKLKEKLKPFVEVKQQ